MELFTSKLWATGSNPVRGTTGVDNTNYLTHPKCSRWDHGPVSTTL